MALLGWLPGLAALAGGCSKVYIADVLAEKLKMCEHYPDLIPVDLTKESLSEGVMDDTNGWGVDRF